PVIDLEGRHLGCCEVLAHTVACRAWMVRDDHADASHSSGSSVSRQTALVSRHRKSDDDHLLQVSAVDGVSWSRYQRPHSSPHCARDSFLSSPAGKRGTARILARSRSRNPFQLVTSVYAADSLSPL